jgi:hypothetical protein
MHNLALNKIVFNALQIQNVFNSHYKLLFAKNFLLEVLKLFFLVIFIIIKDKQTNVIHRAKIAKYNKYQLIAIYLDFLLISIKSQLILLLVILH